MTLTAEQRQEIIETLKRRYSDGMEMIEEHKSKGAYANMPEWLEEFKSANEKIKDLYERLESGEEVELGNGFNDSRNVAWLFLAFATLCGFGNNKKDNE